MSRVLAVAILTILAYYVAAQSPPCLPGYTWSYNSLGQTPCDMTIELGGVCSSTPFQLQSLQQLGPGYVYLGPTQANANACRCSSVYYSLLSACAVCQNHTFLNWSVYKVNCTNVYDKYFKDPIPPETRIPHYAYLDVDVGNGFNVTLAKSAGGSESSALPQSASATSTATPTSAVKSSSNSKAGAIAGGVVGGVVFLALLGVLIFLILRRRKQSTLVPSTYNSVASPEPAMGYGDVKYNSLAPTSVTPGKIYDPNDPSTFPTNDPVSFSTYSHSPEQRAPVTPTFTGNTVVSTPAGPARAGYTGAPEL